MKKRKREKVEEKRKVKKDQQKKRRKRRRKKIYRYDLGENKEKEKIVKIGPDPRERP